MIFKCKPLNIVRGDHGKGVTQMRKYRRLFYVLTGISCPSKTSAATETELTDKIARHESEARSRLQIRIS